MAVLEIEKVREEGQANANVCSSNELTDWLRTEEKDLVTTHTDTQRHTQSLVCDRFCGPDESVKVCCKTLGPIDQTELKSDSKHSRFSGINRRSAAL